MSQPSKSYFFRIVTINLTINLTCLLLRSSMSSSVILDIVFLGMTWPFRNPSCFTICCCLGVRVFGADPDGAVGQINVMLQVFLFTYSTPHGQFASYTYRCRLYVLISQFRGNSHIIFNKILMVGCKLRITNTSTSANNITMYMYIYHMYIDTCLGRYIRKTHSVSSSDAPL